MRFGGVASLLRLVVWTSVYVMSGPFQPLLAFSLWLAIASPVRAEIGVIVAESVGALGFFTRLGHEEYDWALHGFASWIRLPLVEGAYGAAGMSRSQILAGDPRVAVLVLAALIGYDLHQPDARREDIEYVDGLMTLFGQASDIIGREARGTRTKTGPVAPRSRVGVRGLHRERLPDRCVGALAIDSGPLVFSP